MIDREKVIKGLEYHLKELSIGKTCYECPYIGDNPCEIQLIANALELLKEQKGVPYVFDADGEAACGVCGCHFDKAYSNSPKCGKKVDWNA